jgi:ornithine cyclodeaminase
MTLPRIGAEQLREALPTAAAVDALEAAFRAGSIPQAPPRAHVPAGDGDLLLMPAVGEQGAGVKLVTVNPSNPERGLPLVQGAYVLFAPETLEPVALFGGAELTALRTAAVSALATRHLARRDASRLVMFGAGTQAAAHLEGMMAVRSVEEVTIVSRTRETAEALAERARGLGLGARVGSAEDVRAADLICTCTTSPTPVLDGSLLPAGAHVNAVGAFRPTERELDDETVRRGRLVVETREAAFEEAGDLMIPIKDGVIAEENVIADLAEVIGGVEVRRSSRDVTVFKSVGVAYEDLVIARAALDRLSS